MDMRKQAHIKKNQKNKILEELLSSNFFNQ